MSTNIEFTKTIFATSAKELSQLPNNSLGEIAFAGRSNAGKSSAINTITGIQGLAKTSKTPGRTQLINYFQTNVDNIYLVDLPGYGFAKVSREVKAHWNVTLSKYLETREQLLGVVLIMDIRHPLKEHDVSFIEWISFYNKRLHILLTKADKLSKNKANQTIAMVRKSLQEFDNVTVGLFSSLTSLGKDEARSIITETLINSQT